MPWLRFTNGAAKHRLTDQNDHRREVLAGARVPGSVPDRFGSIQQRGNTVAKVKTAPSAEMIAKLGAEAVARVLQSETPLKLKGKEQAVFVSTAGANGPALERCLHGDPAWLTVRKEGKTEIVSVTPSGFQAALPFLNTETLGAAAARFAPTIPKATDRVAFLNDIALTAPAAVLELQPILEAAIRDEQQERAQAEAAQAARREKEQAIARAMELWKANLEQRKNERISSLQRALLAEGVTIDLAVKPADSAVSPEPAVVTVTEGNVPKVSVSDPKTDGDFAFRRDVARQLASAWLATWKLDRPDVRDFLEPAMDNVPELGMIGEVGETVTFSGRLHEGEAGLFPGDKAQIVRPGWILREGEDAEHVVLKAFVSSVR
ncbi:MAG: hypothetical protein LC104_11415 [Bacteroidales bacterium]|nr:hypothetical protein [Bacteroidales bacterium]